MCPFKEKRVLVFHPPPIKIKVSFPGKAELSLYLILDEKKHIKTAKLKGIGELSFLLLLESWRKKLKGHYMKIPLPKGNKPGALVLREALLKAKGQWKFPYKKEILCYCRKVLAHKINLAIISGANNAEEVSILTGAATGCGTCKENIEKVLSFRLINKKTTNE